MLIRLLAPLLAAAGTVSALRNTFPFFLLSTEPIDSDTLHSTQISTAAHVEAALQSILGKSRASRYIFVDQPGVLATDLSDGGAMPKMAGRMRDTKMYKSIVQVPEVIGEVDLLGLAEMWDMDKTMDIHLPPIRGDGNADITEEEPGRRFLLTESDTILEEAFHTILANSSSHVIVYTGVAADSAKASGDRYQMDEPPFQEHMHTDLKRDALHSPVRRRQSQGDDFQHGLPLFEKYQFLSPAIFMGLAVSLLLLLILYVGISAIAGLEVSYMAFSKEMGPQAQKKQQQQQQQ